MEGAGVVEATGPGVADLRPGDRVAYACPPTGAYAEVRAGPAAQMVKLPDAVSDAVAASIMLKGMTAQYLLHDTAPVRAGDHVLVHAAAGGVGLLLCQWAKHLGCTVSAPSARRRRRRWPVRMAATTPSSRAARLRGEGEGGHGRRGLPRDL
jgi:NADPH2:quinone reductase